MSEPALLDALSDRRPIRGRLRRMWYAHQRRSLEAHLYCIGALGPWRTVKAENDLLGVWRRDRKKSGAPGAPVS